ncbi:unnamed protein product [Protopolystoma xenopodis]|uniref:Uncharacterized protein n=1 Tax=Protopolystoma xenopodis TaxID=117903 RepID=A0A3S4ZUE5_9PLAT|nr:unnamed protein product [Protopolystoma xenopodis]
MYLDEKTREAKQPPVLDKSRCFSSSPNEQQASFRQHHQQQKQMHSSTCKSFPSNVSSLSSHGIGTEANYSAYSTMNTDISMSSNSTSTAGPNGSVSGGIGALLKYIQQQQQHPHHPLHHQQNHQPHSTSAVYQEYSNAYSQNLHAQHPYIHTPRYLQYDQQQRQCKNQQISRCAASDSGNTLLMPFSYITNSTPNTTIGDVNVVPPFACISAFSSTGTTSENHLSRVSCEPGSSGAGKNTLQFGLLESGTLVSGRSCGSGTRSNSAVARYSWTESQPSFDISTSGDAIQARTTLPLNTALQSNDGKSMISQLPTSESQLDAPRFSIYSPVPPCMDEASASLPPIPPVSSPSYCSSQSPQVSSLSSAAYLSHGNSSEATSHLNSGQQVSGLTGLTIQQRARVASAALNRDGFRRRHSPSPKRESVHLAGITVPVSMTSTSYSSPTRSFSNAAISIPVTTSIESAQSTIGSSKTYTTTDYTICSGFQVPTTSLGARSLTTVSYTCPSSPTRRGRSDDVVPSSRPIHLDDLESVPVGHVKQLKERLASIVNSKRTSHVNDLGSAVASPDNVVQSGHRIGKFRDPQFDCLQSSNHARQNYLDVTQQQHHLQNHRCNLLHQRPVQTNSVSGTETPSLSSLSTLFTSNNSPSIISTAPPFCSTNSATVATLAGVCSVTNLFASLARSTASDSGRSGSVGSRVAGNQEAAGFVKLNSSTCDLTKMAGPDLTMFTSSSSSLPTSYLVSSLSTPPIPHYQPIPTYSFSPSTPSHPFPPPPMPLPPPPFLLPSTKLGSFHIAGGHLTHGISSTNPTGVTEHSDGPKTTRSCARHNPAISEQLTSPQHFGQPSQYISRRAALLCQAFTRSSSTPPPLSSASSPPLPRPPSVSTSPSVQATTPLSSPPSSPISVVSSACHRHSYQQYPHQAHQPFSPSQQSSASFMPHRSYSSGPPLLTTPPISPPTTLPIPESTIYPLPHLGIDSSNHSCNNLTAPCQKPILTKSRSSGLAQSVPSQFNLNTNSLFRPQPVSSCVLASPDSRPPKSSNITSFPISSNENHNNSRHSFPSNSRSTTNKLDSILTSISLQQPLPLASLGPLSPPLLSPHHYQTLVHTDSSAQTPSITESIGRKMKRQLESESHGLDKALRDKAGSIYS